MLNILTTNNNHNNRSRRNLWEVMVMVYGFGCGDDFMDAYLIPKLIELYTLNVYSLLRVNQTSIKWLKKQLCIRRLIFILLWALMLSFLKVVWVPTGGNRHLVCHGYGLVPNLGTSLSVLKGSNRASVGVGIWIPLATRVWKIIREIGWSDAPDLDFGGCVSEWFRHESMREGILRWGSGVQE